MDGGIVSRLDLRSVRDRARMNNLSKGSLTMGMKAFLQAIRDGAYKYYLLSFIWGRGEDGLDLAV